MLTWLLQNLKRMSTRSGVARQAFSWHLIRSEADICIFDFITIIPVSNGDEYKKNHKTLKTHSRVPSNPIFHCSNHDMNVPILQSDGAIACWKQNSGLPGWYLLHPPPQCEHSDPSELADRRISWSCDPYFHTEFASRVTIATRAMSILSQGLSSRFETLADTRRRRIYQLPGVCNRPELRIDSS